MTTVQTWLRLFPDLGNPYLNAALIFIISAVIAKTTDFIILKIIKARLLAKTKTEFDDKVIDALHRPIFFSIFLGGVYLALQTLEWISGYRIWISRGIGTVLVLIWAYGLLRIALAVIETLETSTYSSKLAQKELIPFFENLARVIIFATALVFMLHIWKINVTPLLASAGIAGIAVGFAARETIADFFGGISIFADQPYVMGDWVVLDTGDVGRVTDIGIRSTRLKTRDEVEISIPNSKIASSKIQNESKPETRTRLRAPVGVAYDSNIEQVEELLKQIADEYDAVLEDPAPRVRFREFGDSSLNFELLCWVDSPEGKPKVLHEINKEIFRRFNQKGIGIPFPQRDVHLDQQSE